MTVLKWIVQCDGCGKKINAIEETFVQRNEEGDFCEECNRNG